MNLVLIFSFNVNALLNFSFIYETERHNGIAELLEVLGRYANLVTKYNVYLLLGECCMVAVFYHKSHNLYWQLEKKTRIMFSFTTTITEYRCELKLHL